MQTLKTSPTPSVSYSPAVRIAQLEAPSINTTLRCEVVHVTPEIATEWMTRNKNFRELREGYADYLALDFKADKWDENGETIKFDCDGNLIDGQHRLSACIKSGHSFVTVVVYGVKKDLNIDNGTKRSLADYIKEHGVSKYSADIASTLRGLLSLRKGAPFNPGRGVRATNNDLMRLLRRETTLLGSVQRVQCLKPEWLPVSISAPLFHVFKERDAELAEKFVLGIIGKIELPINDPVRQLGQRLLTDRGAKYRMSIRARAALTILAWNYWRRGQGCKILKWTESGPTAQDFPAIE